MPLRDLRFLCRGVEEDMFAMPGGMTVFCNFVRDSRGDWDLMASDRVARTVTRVFRVSRKVIAFTASPGDIYLSQQDRTALSDFLGRRVRSR